GVTGAFGRLVGRERIFVLVEREVGLAEIEVRERAAVAVGKRFDGFAVSTEQVVAHAQASGHGRAAVGLGFELSDGIAEVAVAAVVVGHGGGDLLDLARAERGGGNDDLLYIGFKANTHQHAPGRLRAESQESGARTSGVTLLFGLSTLDSPLLTNQ